jgi:hypothetical protein
MEAKIIMNPKMNGDCFAQVYYNKKKKHKNPMNKISFSSTIAQQFTCEMLVRKICQEDLVFKQGTKINATKKKKCEQLQSSAALIYHTLVCV